MASTERAFQGANDRHTVRRPGSFVIIKSTSMIRRIRCPERGESHREKVKRCCWTQHDIVNALQLEFQNGCWSNVYMSMWRSEAMTGHPAPKRGVVTISIF